MRAALLLASLGVPLAFGSAAGAVVVGGAITGGNSLSRGGIFVELSIPFTESNPDNTVGNNNFQSPNLYAFNEKQNIIIPSQIDVNVGTSPMTGDVVASHYVFFDPTSGSQEGYVDFDADIYGIATQVGTLSDSDFLVSSSVTYLNPGARGLEGGDSVLIDPLLPYRILVDWTASTPGDYVRVFTMESAGAPPLGPGPGPSPSPSPSPIPLPAAAWLLLSALGVMVGVGRRFERA